jgi:ribosome maturation factor RimP
MGRSLFWNGTAGAVCPFFVPGVCEVSNAKLNELIQPLVEDLGYEFVGIEYSNNPKNAVLRIYIDEPSRGIAIEDCEQVSREVAALLDVEDPIASNYTLEVSSPGLNRPIFSLVQFETFIGEVISMTSFAPVNNRRKFKGELLAVTGNEVFVDQDGEKIAIAFENIVKARLAPDYSKVFSKASG